MVTELRRLYRSGQVALREKIGNEKMFLFETQKEDISLEMIVLMEG
jgi:hypothetical protein